MFRFFLDISGRCLMGSKRTSRLVLVSSGWHGLRWRPGGLARRALPVGQAPQRFTHPAGLELMEARVRMGGQGRGSAWQTRAKIKISLSPRAYSNIDRYKIDISAAHMCVRNRNNLADASRCFFSARFCLSYPDVLLRCCVDGRFYVWPRGPGSLLDGQPAGKAARERGSEGVREGQGNWDSSLYYLPALLLLFLAGCPA